jgi:hypothetical protein
VVSYQGQTWVDEVAHPYLKNSGELIIMLRVANHAGNGPGKMSGCFAGAPLLAEECILSLRAAQGHLRELARRGLLIPGDPKLVQHIRPDRRPLVYDLAGAHSPGCPGGHDIDGECLPSPTGGKNCYPWQEEENTRSAGSKNCYPSVGKPATGSKKRPARVAESATKSSKELKEFSPLSGDAPDAGEPPVPAEAEGEREAATQKTNHTPIGQPADAIGDTTDTDKVVDAYIASYMATAGLPPRPDAIRSVRAAASALLSVGRSVGNLCLLAAEMGAKGWTDLVRHAQMNPEAAAQPPVARRAWCGECNDGHEPATPAQRLRENAEGRLEKCRCHPGYLPAQPVHA